MNAAPLLQHDMTCTSFERHVPQAWGFLSEVTDRGAARERKAGTHEYEIDGGVLCVFFEGRSKSSSITGPGPEVLARLLLIELVFHAPSRLDHPRTAMPSHISSRE